MSKLKSSSHVIFLIYVFSLPTRCCMFQVSGEQHPQSRKVVNADESDLPNTPLDLEKRRAIAEKYLRKIAEERERRSDLCDSTNIKQNGHQLGHDIETPVYTKPSLDNDFKPVFSDIKGEVIGSKTSFNEISVITESDKEAVKVSDFKQEICVLDSIYVTRWLKKLVLKIEKDANLESSSLSFSFNVDSLDKLKKMSVSKALDIGELDELICSLISTAEVTNQKEYDWSDLTSSTFDKIRVFAMIFSAVICFGLICYICVYYPRLTLFSLIVVVSIMWHWMHLYRQKMAHKHAELAHFASFSSCGKGDLGLFESFQEYIKSFFVQTDCKKYYEALMVDAAYEVSIGVAISEAFASVIFQPLAVMGRALNSFVKGTYDGLSFFLCVVVTFFLFISIMMLCKYRLKLPLFMGTLEPVLHPVGSNVQDVKLSKRKEAIQSNIHGVQTIDHDIHVLQQDNSVYSSEQNAVFEQNNGNILNSGALPRNPVTVDRKLQILSSDTCSEQPQTRTENSNNIHNLSSLNGSIIESTQVEAQPIRENQCFDHKKDEELMHQIKTCESLNASAVNCNMPKCANDDEESAECFNSGHGRKKSCNNKVQNRVSLHFKNDNLISNQGSLADCTPRSTVLNGIDNSKVDCNEVTKSELTSAGSL